MDILQEYNKHAANSILSVLIPYEMNWETFLVNLYTIKEAFVDIVHY
jgi:hypothetical protein